MTAEWNRILVGVDLSPSSDAALAHAERLAEGLRARLDLAYIHQPSVSAVPQMLITPTDEAEDFARAEKQVYDLAARVSDSVPTQVHIRDGEPVSGLLALISELAPDLVVVGSHGRGAVMRLLMGSVATEICRRSPIPVVVVPAPERKASGQAAETT